MWLVNNHFVLVMIGGALGSLARYSVSLWFGRQPFPFATLVINGTGSFLLGLAVLLLLDRFGRHEGWYVLLGTGFCGGYTTFSAFELETYELVSRGRIVPALLYVLASVIAGFLGVLAAVGIVNWCFPKQP